MMSADWRQGSVLERRKHLLESAYKSDCSFLVGQEPDTKEFHAHKLILSCSSEVFEAMFYGALSEKDVVRVTDVTPTAFQALLNHVYCDTLEISNVEMSLSVCSAAHKYNLQTLVSKCTYYITKHMTPVNVCQVLEFSNLTDNTQLKTHCIKMLQSRTEEVLSADSWCDVQVSSIVTLLQQDTLNIQSELSLLSACLRWAQHQLDINNQPEDNNQKDCIVQPDGNIQNDINSKTEGNNEDSEGRELCVTENPVKDDNKDQNCVENQNKEQCDDKGLDIDVKLRDIAAPFLPHIRVLTLTSQQFLQASGSSLYSEHEQLTILKCIAHPTKYKTPGGICDLSTPRKAAIHSIDVYNSVPNVEGDVFDILVFHLKEKILQQVQFQLFPFTCYVHQSESTLSIAKNIIIYGFQFKTMEFAYEESDQQTLVTNNEYNEKFTLKFLNENEEWMAKCEFDGMLKYDAKVNFLFSRPFLVRENSNITIKLKFKQDVKREYPWYFSADKTYLPASDVFSLVNDFNFSCLSQILYKVI